MNARVAPRKNPQHARLMTAEEAIALIPDGASVAVGGTGPVLEPDLLLDTLERRFIASGSPRDLTLVSPMLPGARAGVGGLNAFAHEGMLKRVIGATFSNYRHPRLLDLIRAEKCEGYIIGMGTMVQLMTALGSRKPGVWTTVGIGSFLDPRVEGGRMNARSRDDMAKVVHMDGQEWLHYPVFPVDVALLRGTTADENGYISFEEEPNTLGALEIAQAVKASGGIVIVQVKRLARAGSLDPRLVRIPGALVDAIVLHPAQKQLCESMADPLHGWNPFLAGALKVSYRGLPPLSDPAQRIMMRRAALELRPWHVVNLGAGVATQLPRIALEEGILEKVVFTNEHGIFGGLMATALGGSFVPALNADAIMDSAFQFNFYESGGLNVNVEEGRLRILKEGKFRKFVPQVEQITLNADRAWSRGQRVMYITERAVFERDAQGMVLTEVAPGIDVQKEIAAVVGFPLRVSENLKTMDERIFTQKSMGLECEFNEEEQ